MGLFSKTTNTTSTSSQPWGPAQPALQQGLTDAMTAYRSGVGSQPYSGSTVVPFSNQTTQGLNWNQGVAKSAMGQGSFNQQFNAVQGLSQNGGLNNLQDQQVARLQGIAGGNGLNAMQNKGAGYLDKIANGSMMEGNPYLNDIINRSSEDIRYQTGLNASGMGRYGSGGHDGVTANAIGDMSSGLRYQNYTTEAARRDAAIRDYFGMGTTGHNQRTDAIGSLFNAGQQQQQNVRDNNAALQSAYAGLQMPGQTMQDVGAQYEDLYGRQINDKLRLYNEQQNQPWNQIAKLNAVASGAGSMGSTGTQTAQGPSRASSMLGGALGGFGATNSLWGGGLGALAGIL